ncbi:right-handed parallel beta-helix repeat-containing protein [Aeromicrobium sp. Leaf291]|uniref:right-handed parallel beta-helix repeat-containing protein n=1 Tax=Aeromicrobium sp. Leaf291 TaxID=1736325 RepID=UPI000701984C|nr:right-handed parallel beta-helix repeat-containing protein [Aeromicrobium sp. Leaf291]KQP83736.1 hypothetical protein ASF35_01795 [Aeromicrobium sp. Leaf291]
MADCTVTLNIGDGPDEAVHPGDVLIHRVIEGVHGGLDILPKALKPVPLRRDPFATVDLEQGEVYRFEFPRHKLTFYKLIPATPTALYSSLTTVPPTPALPIPSGVELAELIAEILGGLFVPKGSQVVNVADHGAIGDGAANDTAAVVSALDELEAQGGGILFYPSSHGTGVYVQADVPLISNLTVVSDGAVIRPVSYDAFTAFAGAAVQGYGSTVKNVHFEGLRFEGSILASKNAALTLHHAQNVSFSRCTWTEAQGSGHCLDLLGCRDVLIEDCTFQGFRVETGRGFAEAVQIDNSTSVGCSGRDHTGSFDGLPCENITVRGSRFLPITIGGTTYPAPNPIGGHAVVDGMYHRNIRFENNYVVDCVPTDTQSSAAWLRFVGIKGLHIESNTFIATTTPNTRAILTVKAATGYSLASVGDPSATTTAITPMVIDNAHIVGNLFTGFKGTGTYDLIEHGGDAARYAKNVTVTDNDFIDCYPDATVGVDTGPDCVQVYKTDGILVANNYAEKVKRFLVADNVDRIRVLGNTVVDSNFQAISIFNNGSQVQVQGNSFYDYHGGINVSGYVGVIITGNLLLKPKSYSGWVGHIRIPGGSQIIVTNNIVDNTAATAHATQNTAVEFLFSATGGYERGTLAPGLAVVAALNGGATGSLETDVAPKASPTFTGTAAFSHVDLMGRVRNSLTTTAGNLTLSTTSSRIHLVDATAAARTVTLPATTTTGVRWTIKRSAGANSVTINPPGGGTIDGTASYTLSTLYQYVEIMTTGTSGVFMVTGKG